MLVVGAAPFRRVGSRSVEVDSGLDGASSVVVSVVVEGPGSRLDRRCPRECEYRTVSVVKFCNLCE